MKILKYFFMFIVFYILASLIVGLGLSLMFPSLNEYGSGFATLGVNILLFAVYLYDEKLNSKKKSAAS